MKSEQWIGQRGECAWRNTVWRKLFYKYKD